MTFIDFKNEFDETYSKTLLLKRSLVPVDGGRTFLSALHPSLSATATYYYDSVATL